MARLKRLKGQQDRKRGRSAGNGGAGCLIAFGVVWMLMVLVFDVIIISGFVKLEYAKSRYQPIDAVIARSQVEVQNTSDGTNYIADIAYAYSVQGQQYTSDRHSFFEVSSSSRDFAEQIVQKYPVGAQVQAFYNPSDPSRAVIELNDSSFPYATVLFLTPFHCIGIGLIYGGSITKRRMNRDPHLEKIAGYVIRRRGRTVVFHDAYWPGWLLFFVLLGSTNFVAVFVVMFAYGFAASKSTVLVVWLVCFAVAWFVPYVKDQKRTRSDKRLTINWEDGWFMRGNSGHQISIVSIVKLKVRSTGTNMKINNQEWYKHTIEAIDVNRECHRLLLAKGQAHRGKELCSWFETEFGLTEQAKSAAKD